MQSLLMEGLRDRAGLTKTFREGTHRLCDPGETFGKVCSRLEQFGITRVANVTGLDRIGLPVIMVTRPNSRSVTVSQGKGLSLDAARASGVMEAIELHHAETIGKPLLLASWEECTRRLRAVDARLLPPSREAAFNPFTRILWIEGFDLLAQEPAWVPLDIVTTDATGPEPAGMFCSTSNGLASGNHPVEAICHGLCELIERDATTLWYQGDPQRQRLSRLDLTTVTDPAVVSVLSRLAAAEMAPLVWEVTSDIAVPVFLCLLCEREDRPERDRYASTGMGCHPAREIALLRCLTEAAQTRLTLIAGARDDVFRGQYQWSPAKQAMLAQYRRLHPQAAAWRRFDQAPSFAASTLGEDLQGLLARLAAAGLDSVIAVDLSQPGIDIPVVRMVVPGLEAPSSASDYAPGQRARRLQATSP